MYIWVCVWINRIIIYFSGENTVEHDTGSNKNVDDILRIRTPIPCLSLFNFVSAGYELCRSNHSNRSDIQQATKNAEGNFACKTLFTIMRKQLCHQIKILYHFLAVSALISWIQGTINYFLNKTNYVLQKHRLWLHVFFLLARNYFDFVEHLFRLWNNIQCQIKRSCRCSILFIE